MQIDFAAAFVPAATADPAKELPKGKDGGPAFPDLELGDGKEVDAVVDEAIVLAAAVPTPTPVSPPPEPSTNIENYAEADEPQTTSGSNKLDGVDKNPAGPRLAAFPPVPAASTRTTRQLQASTARDWAGGGQVTRAANDRLVSGEGETATDSGDTILGPAPTLSAWGKPVLGTESKDLSQDEISLPRASARAGGGIQAKSDPSGLPASRGGADAEGTEKPVIDRMIPRTAVANGTGDTFIETEKGAPETSARPDRVEDRLPRTQALPVNVASDHLGPTTRAHADTPDRTSATLIADIRQSLKSLVESVQVPVEKVASILKSIATGDDTVGIPESLQDFAAKAKALLDQIRTSNHSSNHQPVVSAIGIDLAPINDKVKLILTARAIEEKIPSPKAIEGREEEENSVAPVPTTHTHRPEVSVRTQPTKIEPAVSSAVIERVIERVQELIDSAKPRSVTLRLDPPELGKIELTVKTTGHRVETHIVASSSDVRALLESNRDQLVQALQNRGLELGQMFVGSDAGGKRDAESRQWTELRRLLQPESVEGAIRVSSRPLLRLSTSALDVSV